MRLYVSFKAVLNANKNMHMHRGGRSNSSLHTTKNEIVQNTFDAHENNVFLLKRQHERA